MSLRDVRLRLVKEVHFGKSERTHYDEVEPALRNSMKPGDCFCFISKQSDQYLFVETPVQTNGAADRFMLVSHRFRYSHKTSPSIETIDFAGQAKGLRIVGRKKIAECQAAIAKAHLEKRAKARRAAAA